MRFESLEKQLIASIDDQRRAITKAETAADRRFDGVNEFRASLSDQQRTLIPRLEFEAMRDAMVEKIATLERQLLSQTTRSSTWNQGWLLIVSIGSLILTLILIFYYLRK